MNTIWDIIECANNAVSADSCKPTDLIHQRAKYAETMMAPEKDKEDKSKAYALREQFEQCHLELDEAIDYRQEKLREQIETKQEVIQDALEREGLSEEERDTLMQENDRLDDLMDSLDTELTHLRSDDGRKDTIAGIIGSGKEAYEHYLVHAIDSRDFERNGGETWNYVFDIEEEFDQEDSDF